MQELADEQLEWEVRAVLGDPEQPLERRAGFQPPEPAGQVVLDDTPLAVVPVVPARVPRGEGVRRRTDEAADRGGVGGGGGPIRQTRRYVYLACVRSNRRNSLAIRNIAPLLCLSNLTDKRVSENLLICPLKEIRFAKLSKEWPISIVMLLHLA